MLGHDADTVSDEGISGAEDPAVLDAALKSGRVLFTLDKGIADLQRYPTSHHAGVVVLRPDKSGRGAVIAFVRERLPEILALDLANHLTVVGVSRIRQR